jgi:hypothetical protein
MDGVMTDCGGAESSSWLPQHTLSVRRALLFTSDTLHDLSFGIIQDIVVDDTGRIYVLDGMNRRVSVHNSNGRALRAFGRKGEGPGEFGYPTELYFASPDTLKVFDAVLFRATTFSTSGEVLGTISPPGEARIGQIDEIRFAPNSELYMLSYKGFQESLLSALGTAAKGLVRGRNVIKRWEASAGDWINVIEVPGLEVYVDLNEGTILDVAFAKRPLWAVAPQGLWHADNSRYQFTMYSREGVEVCRIQVAWDPMETSRKERDDYYAAADVAEDPRISPQHITRIRKQREAIPYPDHKPAIRSFLVAQNGDLWIDPTDESTSGSETTWHILSPTGEPRGAVNLPRRFRPMFIVEDRIYGRELGDLDVHQVAEYRLSATG